MNLCERCNFLRRKIHDPTLAECKHSTFTSLQILKNYEEFTSKGACDTPFKVVAAEGFKSDPEHCWPLQYHPNIIASCEGFKEKVDSLEVKSEY